MILFCPILEQCKVPPSPPKKKLPNVQNEGFHHMVPLDDHLQEAGPHLYNHEKGMKKVFLGPFTNVFWGSKNQISMNKLIKIFTFADVQGRGADPLANCPAAFLSYFSLWICYEIQLTNQGSKWAMKIGWVGQLFSPPPLTVKLTVKYPFFTTPLS